MMTLMSLGRTKSRLQNGNVAFHGWWLAGTFSTGSQDSYWVERRTNERFPLTARVLLVKIASNGIAVLSFGRTRQENIGSMVQEGSRLPVLIYIPMALSGTFPTSSFIIWEGQLSKPSARTSPFNIGRITVV